jgi:hypothetical protein
MRELTYFLRYIISFQTRRELFTSRLEKKGIITAISQFVQTICKKIQNLVTDSTRQNFREGL